MINATWNTSSTNATPILLLLLTISYNFHQLLKPFACEERFMYFSRTPRATDETHAVEDATLLTSYIKEDVPRGGASCLMYHCVTTHCLRRVVLRGGDAVGIRTMRP